MLWKGHGQLANKLNSYRKHRHYNYLSVKASSNLSYIADAISAWMAGAMT